MKEKLISNWGLKLVSVLFAMILWLVVVNIDDPVITKKFKDIPVKILSENLIDEAGEIYEVQDHSDRLDVTVKAKRSVMESLSVSDFNATADFAERISENSIPIKVQVTKQGEVLDIYMHNNTVKIHVEEKAHKEIPVEIQLVGKVADGFTVGSAKSQESVNIAGPASIVSQVAKVVVKVDINGASEDIEMSAKGSFCAENGSVIENSRLEGDISKFDVKVHLLHTKSIDLNLTTEGEPASEYRCTDIQYSPTTITIAGEQADLEQINTLQIPSSELNIQNAKENITKEIDITKYLPEKLIICDAEHKKIKVTLVISELDGREFKIPMSSVGILNMPSGMEVSLDNSKSVSVIVKGRSEDLSGLSRDEIHVSVNLKNKAIGTYNLQAEVTVPNGYSVMNKPMVSVTLLPIGQGGNSVVVPTQQPNIPADSTVQTYNPQVTQPANTQPTPTPPPAIESQTPPPEADTSMAPAEDEE